MEDDSGIDAVVSLKRKIKVEPQDGSPSKLTRNDSFESGLIDAGTSAGGVTSLPIRPTSSATSASAFLDFQQQRQQNVIGSAVVLNISNGFIPTQSGPGAPKVLQSEPTSVAGQTCHSKCSKDQDCADEDQLKTIEHQFKTGEHGLAAKYLRTNTAAPKKPSRLHRCRICSKIFAGADFLSKHFLLNHSNEAKNVTSKSDQPTVKTGDPKVRTHGQQVKTSEARIRTREPQVGTGEHLSAEDQIKTNQPHCSANEHLLKTSEHQLKTVEPQFVASEHGLKSVAGQTCHSKCSKDRDCADEDKTVTSEHQFKTGGHGLAAWPKKSVGRPRLSSKTVITPTTKSTDAKNGESRPTTQCKICDVLFADANSLARHTRNNRCYVFAKERAAASVPPFENLGSLSSAFNNDVVVQSVTEPRQTEKRVDDEEQEVNVNNEIEQQGVKNAEQGPSEIPVASGNGKQETPKASRYLNILQKYKPIKPKQVDICPRDQPNILRKRKPIKPKKVELPSQDLPNILRNFEAIKPKQIEICPQYDPLQVQVVGDQVVGGQVVGGQVVGDQIMGGQVVGDRPLQVQVVGGKVTLDQVTLNQILQIQQLLQVQAVPEQAVLQVGQVDEEDISKDQRERLRREEEKKKEEEKEERSEIIAEVRIKEEEDVEEDGNEGDKKLTTMEGCIKEEILEEEEITKKGRIEGEMMKKGRIEGESLKKGRIEEGEEAEKLLEECQLKKESYFMKAWKKRRMEKEEAEIVENNLQDYELRKQRYLMKEWAKNHWRMKFGCDKCGLKFRSQEHRMHHQTKGFCESYKDALQLRASLKARKKNQRDNSKSGSLPRKTRKDEGVNTIQGDEMIRDILLEEEGEVMTTTEDRINKDILEAEDQLNEGGNREDEELVEDYSESTCEEAEEKELPHLEKWAKKVLPHSRHQRMNFWCDRCGLRFQTEGHRAIHQMKGFCRIYEEAMRAKAEGRLMKNTDFWDYPSPSNKSGRNNAPSSDSLSKNSPSNNSPSSNLLSNNSPSGANSPSSANITIRGILNKGRPNNLPPKKLKVVTTKDYTRKKRNVPPSTDLGRNIFRSKSSISNDFPSKSSGSNNLPSKGSGSNNFQSKNVPIPIRTIRLKNGVVQGASMNPIVVLHDIMKGQSKDKKTWKIGGCLKTETSFKVIQKCAKNRKSQKDSKKGHKSVNNGTSQKNLKKGPKKGPKKFCNLCKKEFHTMSALQIHLVDGTCEFAPNILNNDMPGFRLGMPGSSQYEYPLTTQQPFRSALGQGGTYQIDTDKMAVKIKIENKAEFSDIQNEASSLALNLKVRHRSNSSQDHRSFECHFDNDSMAGKIKTEAGVESDNEVESSSKDIKSEASSLGLRGIHRNDPSLDLNKIKTEAEVGHENEKEAELSADVQNEASSLSLKVCYRNDPSKLSEDPRGYECHLCGMRFEREMRLTAHLQLHDPDGGADFVCNICLKRFTNDIALERHKYSEKHYNSFFCCHLCDRKFTKQGLLDYHQKISHTATETKVTYSCNMCRLEFEQKEDRDAHMVQHYGKVLLCHVCDRGFMKPENLARHLFIHMNEVEHRCWVCRTDFQDEHVLKSHIDNHRISGVRSFVPSYLKDHAKLIRRAKKPYICNLCDSAFSYTSSLISHLPSHLVASGSCDVCGMEFVRETDHVRHGRQCHLVIREKTRVMDNKQRVKKCHVNKNSNNQHRKEIGFSDGSLDANEPISEVKLETIPEEVKRALLGSLL